jgi:hypothetical protein
MESVSGKNKSRTHRTFIKKRKGDQKMNPLNQNPHQYLCEKCGDVADELYGDRWLCIDCVNEEEDENL